MYMYMYVCMYVCMTVLRGVKCLGGLPGENMSSNCTCTGTGTHTTTWASPKSTPRLLRVSKLRFHNQ